MNNDKIVALNHSNRNPTRLAPVVSGVQTRQHAAFENTCREKQVDAPSVHDLLTLGVVPLELQGPPPASELKRSYKIAYTLQDLGAVSAYLIQSAHFAGSPTPPQGMMGTVEVEFCGEPSINLSE